MTLRPAEAAPVVRQRHPNGDVALDVLHVFHGLLLPNSLLWSCMREDAGRLRVLPGARAVGSGREGFDRARVLLPIRVPREPREPRRARARLGRVSVPRATRSTRE